MQRKERRHMKREEEEEDKRTRRDFNSSNTVEGSLDSSPATEGCFNT